MTQLLALGAVVFCLGALLGASWTTQIMGNVSRRHAAERRSLNDGWRALEVARRSHGEPVHCARCHQSLFTSQWALAGPALIDEEDDGT